MRGYVQMVSSVKVPFSADFSRWWISDETNRKPATAAITSEMTAAQSMVTILFDTAAITMDVGTNMMTSLRSARMVDFTLFPEAWRIPGRLEDDGG